MKRIMAVYDVDPFYAERFAEYANEKERTPFTVVAFSSLAKLQAFAERQEVELLLAGGTIPDEELKNLPVSQIIRLSEDGRELMKAREIQTSGEMDDEKEMLPLIYKYQASDAVLREVMACYDRRDAQNMLTETSVNSRVIGVYSPIGRCGKTGFCLTLGQALAADQKVLYINLEDISGLSAMMGTRFQGSLSDLMYYFRQGDFNRMRLESVVYSWGGLDYVPPAAYAEDLAEMKGEELAQLIQIISSVVGYDVIILDIGHLGRSAEPFMNLCSVIYAPMQNDPISAAKMEEWKDYLKRSGRGKIWEKTEALVLPEPKKTGTADAYLEQLRWGEMGEYVRTLLRRAEGGWLQ